MGVLGIAPGELPIAAWAALLLAAIFLGQYVYLRVRQQPFLRRGAAAERTLSLIAGELRAYAGCNHGALPLSLEDLAVGGGGSVLYRYTPRLDLDARLILLVDGEPTHKLLEYPVLRDGRGVVFCSGRLLVAADEVVEKLIAADDALRERLGLPPAPGRGFKPHESEDRDGA